MAKVKNHLWIIVAGLVVGLSSVLLVANGNPGNMGFCIACFLRDIAGGIGMHRAAVVQYIRPEIIGLVLGAFINLPWFRMERNETRSNRLGWSLHQVPCSLRIHNG